VPTITTKEASKGFALAAAAFSVGVWLTLPPECGPSADENLPLLLTIAAGCSLAAAFVFMGRRTSIWLWVGAVACGLALSAVLVSVQLLTWVGTCTN
jgi:uncharacterized integral membrane protein